jgi:hypothetical protein
MHTIEREYQQKSTPVVSERQRNALPTREQRRLREQKAKLRAPTSNQISAQQFRDMRRAERLRERPFAEQRQ